MTSWINSFFLLFIYCQVSVCIQLKYFETLSSIVERSFTKRDSGVQELIKHLSFKFLNRTFEVRLKSGTSVLAKGFKSYLVQEDGRKEEFLFDESNVYTGHLSGKPSVFVNAHKEDTLWSIHIIEEDDIYAVEPVHNQFKPSENPHEHPMFAYRASDLIDKEGRCGVKNSAHVKHLKNGDLVSYNVVSKNNSATGSRKERGARGPRNTCLLHLVGDYDFFNFRCRKNFVLCSSLIVSYVNVADNIYQTSEFVNAEDESVGCIRLQIAKLELYQSYTVSETKGELPHFNAKGYPWDSDKKLAAFGTAMTYQKKVQCHFHLFTQHPMPERVLGLSYISGACAEIYVGRYLYSCGITSGADIATGEITSLQMNLVFVHGHNLGSEHDPYTPECSATESRGGDFLMWDRAVSGKYPNNKKFSPCSLKLIGIAKRSFYCLTEFSTVNKFCGNGIVDEGEECDAGARQQEDPCCDDKCQLKPQAMCSETNRQCCVNCKMAPNTTVCSDSGTAECQKKSFCTGQSYECPHSEKMDDWTPCIADGFCYDGDCKGFCEMKSVQTKKDIQPCLCRDEINACKGCCFDNSDPKNPGDCQVHNNQTYKDGRLCYAGYCVAGVCKPFLTSSIKRIAAFLKNIQLSSLAISKACHGSKDYRPNYSSAMLQNCYDNKQDMLTRQSKFMRSNIAPTVIFLSLLIWIPCSCLISRFDRDARHEREIELFIQRSLMAKCQKGEGAGRVQTHDHCDNRPNETIVGLIADLQGHILCAVETNSLLPSHRMRTRVEIL